MGCESVTWKAIFFEMPIPLRPGTTLSLGWNWSRDIYRSRSRIRSQPRFSRLRILHFQTWLMPITKSMRGLSLISQDLPRNSRDQSYFKSEDRGIYTSGFGMDNPAYLYAVMLAKSKLGSFWNEAAWIRGAFENRHRLGRRIVESFTGSALGLAPLKKIKSAATAWTYQFVNPFVYICLLEK